jgi:hypothetical protein
MDTCLIPEMAPECALGLVRTSIRVVTVEGPPDGIVDDVMPHAFE